MRAIAVLTLALAPFLCAETIYVGSYTGSDSKGIEAFRFDAASGKLAPLGLVAETENPSFLAVHPSGKFLYAVNETETFGEKPGGAVSAFSIDRETGKLNLLNQVASRGGAPCHIVIDASGQAAVVANYNGGNFVSFPLLPDGKLGEAVSIFEDTGSGPHERQAAPHPHQTIIADKLLLGADLGTDQIQLFHLDAATAKLTASTPASAILQAGFGPRHLVVSGDKKFVYVLSELTSSVGAMEYNATTGPAKELATVSALPADFKGNNTAAEIMLDARGRTLYTSNRGHDSIAVFSVDAKTGALQLTANVGSGGKTPRFFTLDSTGRFLLAANQGSGNITVFTVDQETGALTPSGEVAKVGSPVCIVFVK